MKKIIIALLILVPVQFALAQSEVDALRYSQTYFGSTSRSIGMAGATGALGADMSALSINPAGIGLYKRSEAALTLGLHEGLTETFYLGNSEERNDYSFDLQNAGAVFSFKSTDTRSEWKNFQFGIGFNRLKNFNNEFQIAGSNPYEDGTIMRPFYDYATDYGNANLQPSELENYAAFDAWLAYNTDLLYDVDGDNTNGYQWGYDAIYGGVYQQMDVNTSGALDEMFISFGGNFEDKLYLGATIGIQSIHYVKTSTYYEADVADTIPYFNSLSKIDELETTGSGVNLKLGAIYRAAPWLRLGLAYHSPTFYGDMRDVYSSYMGSSLTFDPEIGAERQYSETSVGEFEYQLITPSRYIASATMMIQQYGLISVDYEVVNYASATLDSESDDFSSSNEYISTNFKTQSNLRLGTEWRYGAFYARGGYAMYGSPFETSGDYGEATFKTLGIGYRSGSFSMDFAYMNSQRSDTYYMYDRLYAESAVNDYQQNQYMLTFGLQF